MPEDHVETLNDLIKYLQGLKKQLGTGTQKIAMSSDSEGNSYSQISTQSGFMNMKEEGYGLEPLFSDDDQESDDVEYLKSRSHIVLYPY